MNTSAELKLPPHSISAEQSVLGALLLAGSSAVDRIEGMLTEQDFYRAEHREIFTAISRLAKTSQGIDVITVAEQLEGLGSLEKVGGMHYLGNLAHNTPGAANIANYAHIVKSRALQRGLIALADEIRGNCYSPEANVAEIISAADSAMIRLIGTSGADDPAILSTCLGDAIEDIDARARGARRSGLQTGIADFDAMTNGLEPGQLVIIAARPSVGKTAVALNIADHVARSGESVLFFSLEMTRRELTQRLLALRVGISVEKMRSGQLATKEWDSIAACQGAAEGQRLFLVDRSSIGVPYVRAAARKTRRENELSLIIVDYLGLMKGDGQTRTQEIGSISRGLKALAKELHVPIIAMAQLNRGVESRTDKRPGLSDLRDSGEVEQDADIVAMIHREELYNSSPEWRGVAELLLRKNRNGPVGESQLLFRADLMRFSKYTGANPRRVETGRTSKSHIGGFQ